MERPTITESRDDLETAILLALHSGPPDVEKMGKRRIGDVEQEEVSLAQFCPKVVVYPHHCLTFDANSGERLYTADITQIIVDPVLAIGRRLEVMMLCEDGTLKWTCAVPMSRPVGLVAGTNRPVAWFAFHYRHIMPDGRQSKYVKRPVAVVGNDVAPMRIASAMDHGFRPVQDREEMRQQLAIMMSVYEDCHRTGAFLATVEENIRLSFPVSAEAYKDFFRLRDGPNNTPTNRKNPILHWCAKHMRATPTKGEQVEVSRHMRGTEVLTVGPMTLSIAPTGDQLRQVMWRT